MLHVHRAERADALVAALRDLLAAPLDDPFAPELVAVPTRGIERWLAQTLSTGLGTTDGRRDGVCANVDFPSPGRLVSEAVAAASGIDPEPTRGCPTGWSGRCSRSSTRHWREPWLARARRPPRRRAPAGASAPCATSPTSTTATRLHRPEMVRGWAAATRRTTHWQAELWRRLRATVGQPSPAERLDDGRARGSATRRISSTLPPRLSLFGLTRLPAGYLDVLGALAAAPRRPPVPPAPVAGAVGRGGAACSSGRRGRRAGPTTPPPPRRSNPLLASWGRDAASCRSCSRRRASTSTTTIPRGRRGRTLLARLQADVRARPRPPRGATTGRCSPPTTAPRRSTPATAAPARSRSCATPILHLLADDPTLEPRDVIVMCPDIEAFAPLIQATFGAGEASRPRTTSRRAADAGRPTSASGSPTARCARPTRCSASSPSCSTSPTARLTASQVLDLADREPVRRRFRFDDDDLARLEEWVRDGGIRWGLDAAHRAPFKLEAFDAGTWRAGLDRLLLGVTMTEDEQRLFGGVLPLDDVEQRRHRPRRPVRRARRPPRSSASTRSPSRSRSTTGRPPSADAADALTATAPGDAWQRAELQRLLDDVVDERAHRRRRRRPLRSPRSARCWPSACRAARPGPTSAPAT